jgi:hypothetical protein
MQSLTRMNKNGQHLHISGNKLEALVKCSNMKINLRTNNNIKHHLSSKININKYENSGIY